MDIQSQIDDLFAPKPEVVEESFPEVVKEEKKRKEFVRVKIDDDIFGDLTGGDLQDLTEALDEVQESIDVKKADMGEVITDFRNSDAPQFKGKSDKKKQQMAIAAKLNAESYEERLMNTVVSQITKNAKNENLQLKEVPELNEERIKNLETQLLQVRQLFHEATMVSGIGQGGDGQTPGSGEVKLSRMDDVNSENLKAGDELIWDGSVWNPRPAEGTRPPIYDGTDDEPTEHPSFTPGSEEAELIDFDIWIDEQGGLHYYYNDKWNSVKVYTKDVLPTDAPTIITPNGETFLNQKGFNEWLYTRTDRRPIIDAIPPTIHPDFPADPLRAGDFWIDSNDSKLYYYEGNVWEPIAGAGGRPPIFSDTEPTEHPDFTAPDNALEIGDIWYDSNDYFKQYLWDGAAWVHPQDDREEAFTRFYEVVDSAVYNSGNNATMTFGVADGADLSTVTNIKIAGTDITNKIRYKYVKFDKLIVEDERNGAYAQYVVTAVNSDGDYDVVYETGNGVSAADFGQTFALDRSPNDDGIVVSETAPTQVLNGSLWFDSSPDSLVLFVYYDPDGDPNTAAWIPASPPVSLDGINATIDTALIVQDSILGRLDAGETIQSTLQTDVGNRVSKAGDTMSGSLTLSTQGQANDDGVRFYMKDNSGNTNLTIFPTGTVTGKSTIRVNKDSGDCFQVKDSGGNTVKWKVTSEGHMESPRLRLMGGNNATMTFGVADGADLSTVTNIKIAGTDITNKIRYKYVKFDKLIVEDERNGAYAQYVVTAVNSDGDYDVVYETGNGVSAADFGQTFALDRSPNDDGIVVSETAPTQVLNGSLWFDSSPDSLVLFVYYDPDGDPNTAAWIPASPPVSLDGINATIDTALIVQDSILGRLDAGETIQSTLQTDVGNRVSKAGDTMSGSLTLSTQGQANDDGVRFYMKDNSGNTNLTIFPTGTVTGKSTIRVNKDSGDCFQVKDSGGNTVKWKVTSEGHMESPRLRLMGGNSANRDERVIDVKQGQAGRLAYNSSSRLNWGSSNVWIGTSAAAGDSAVTVNLDLQNNPIKNVSTFELKHQGSAGKKFIIQGETANGDDDEDFFYSYKNNGGTLDAINYTGKMDSDTNLVNKKYVDDAVGGAGGFNPGDRVAVSGGNSSAQNGGFYYSGNKLFFKI